MKNIRIFCNKNSINFESLKPLKYDASKRRYYRFTNNNKEFLLMDSSLEIDSLRRFIKISKWLKSNRFSSPEIYIKDEKNGILMIEDFGNTKYSIYVKKKRKKKNFIIDKRSICLFYYQARKSQTL